MGTGGGRGGVVGGLPAHRGGSGPLAGRLHLRNVGRSRPAADLAVRCAAARRPPFDPGRAVLVPGDVHAFNALLAPERAGSGEGLVGLISEPAHDLGVIQNRGVQGWIGDLAAGDPQHAVEIFARRRRRAGRLARADPEAGLRRPPRHGHLPRLCRSARAPGGGFDVACRHP